MRNLKILKLLIVALFLSTPLISEAQPEIYGYLESDGYVFVNDSARFAKQINEFRLNFSSSKDNAGLFASANIYATPGGIQADLWEGYVDYYGSVFDIRAGKQIITWGTTDGINPTDNLNPQDLGRKSPFSETSDRKIPVNMLQANLYAGNWKFTGVWIPDFHAYGLPDTTTWRMSRPSLDLTPPPGAVVDDISPVSGPSSPANTLENSEYAAKVSSGIFGVDFSLSYYHGWDDFPTLHSDVKLNSVDQSGTKHLTATPYLRYHSLDVIGGDFATSLFGLGIRGEGGYFITEDTDETNPFIQDPYWHYVFGLDYTFQNGLYLNGQFSSGLFNRYGIDKSNEENYQAMLALTYDMNNYNSIEIGSMFALEDENYVLKPKYTRTLGNAIDLTLGAYIIDGNTGEHFGAFRENDQIYAELRYNF